MFNMDQKYDQNMNDLGKMYFGDRLNYIPTWPIYNQ